mgnify:CR=1 FL=1
MKARMGRPPKEIKKSVNLGLRLTQETADKLKECADKLSVSRTVIIEKLSA